MKHMQRRNFWFGIIIASVIIASGLFILQSGSSYSVEKGVSDTYYQETLLQGGGRAPMAKEAAAEAPPPATLRDAALVKEQKVIKTSYLSLEVDSYKNALGEIEGIAFRFGGYTSNSSVQDIAGRKVGYVTVRVPQKNFEDAVREIEAVGRLQQESISSEDVTLQYIDVQARLDNAKRQEEQYLKILGMATTVEDVLAVQVQLERVRADIESMQGTMNYLNNQIDYATVEVQLSEPEKVVHESRLGDALNKAVEAFLSALRGIIIFIGFFIPIAIFLTILALAGQFIYRKLFKEH